MVKIYTSYFYMVRFMEPHHIPLSTAKWDPRWYHNFQGQGEVFLDTRGVLNGMRASQFAPDDKCSSLCLGKGYCPNIGQGGCEFLKCYAEQLAANSAQEFQGYLESQVPMLRSCLHLDRDPEFILLVHEAPGNKCSEREAIQRWFAKGGIEVVEWRR